ncbi:MAG TPA: hypothetical protein VHC69_35130 [Polyangiaceae bacterium]|nr:hypothetical protein [Polyangiaceae bacterium]
MTKKERSGAEMKLNAWYLAALTLFMLVIASQGQYAAQIGVLGLTLGIFFGTISLRRPGGDATTTHPGHG